MILNKEKIINEIVRRIKNKAGFDTNHQEIKKLQREVRSLRTKLSRVSNEVKELKNEKVN
tara:strand:- start:28620 stop:28799 length:180 start_codon:yes stop_codon:yes gene_type:complete